MKTIYLKLKEFSPWFMAGMAAWLSGIAANAMWDTIHVWRRTWPGRFDLWNFSCIALFFVMVGTLFWRREVFFRPRTRFLKDILKVPPRKHLILFLSHLNPPYEQYEKGVPAWLLPLSDPPDLNADFGKMVKLKDSQQKFWNWEMPLRAIFHHREKLANVILICSNAETSMGAVHQFISICKRYEKLKEVEYYVFCKGHLKLIEAPGSAISKDEGLNFDSFEQLSEAVWHALGKLRKWKAREKEITIDFTGGLKPTSVVAAATTFNRKINAQYVHTKSYQVIGYDVIFASSGKNEQDVI